MSDPKVMKKTVVFAPQTLTSLISDEDKSPYRHTTQEDLEQNPIDDLKNTLSSFWTFNPDFFDYPAISFNEEGSATWGKIIDENIFQPFLPKNRLILRHIVQGLKQEQQKKFSIFDERKGVKPIMKKSSTFIDSVTGVSANHIEKILQGIRKKMERKHVPVPKRSKADIYTLRSVAHCKRFLRKKDRLNRAEEEDGVVNHNLYGLDLSLHTLEKEDFFGLNEIEAEEPKREPIKTKKSTEYGALRVITHSAVTISPPKHDPSLMPLPANVLKEQLISKKTVRRKSCCCTVCGGISTFEKNTADIVVDREELIRGSVRIPIDKSFLLVEHGFSPKEKSTRSSRMSQNVAFTPASKNNKGGFLSLNPTDTFAQRSSKNLLEMPGLTPTLERKKSRTNLECDDTKQQPPSRRISRNFTLSMPMAPFILPANEQAGVSSLSPTYKTSTGNLITMYVPKQNKLESPRESQSAKKKNRENVMKVLVKPASKAGIKQSDSPKEQKKAKNNKTKLPLVTVIKLKKNKSDNKNESQSQLKIFRSTSGCGFTSLSERVDRDLLVPTRHITREAITVKNDDLMKARSPSPPTATTMTEASFGLSHKRNLTVQGGLTLSARLKTDETIISSQTPGVPISLDLRSNIPSINLKETITKTYKTGSQRVPFIGIPLQTSSAVLSPAVTSPNRTKVLANILTTSPRPLVLSSPYASPKSSQGKRIMIQSNKFKGMSLAINPNDRVPTCP